MHPGQAGVVMVGVAGGPVAPNGVVNQPDQLVVPTMGGVVAPPRGSVALFAYASVGKRCGALLIDALCQFVVTVISYVALLAGLGSAVSYGLLLVATVGFMVLLIVMAGAGTSPGKKMLGIQVVRAGDGSRPGFGLGFGRLLLRGLLLGVTLYIAGLSPWWDSSRRKRAWWDIATDTVVIDPTRTTQPLPSPHVRSAVRTTSTWSDRPSPTPTTFARPIAHPGPSQPDYPVAEMSWSGGSQPMSRAVITGIPGSPSAAAPAEIEHTRLAQSRRPVAQSLPSKPNWSLVMDNGEILQVASPMLIGRDPAVDPGEDAALKKLGDETRSVSKTHLRVDPAVAGLLVTDRHSTNGVAIVVAGMATSCLPGQSMPAPDGCTVRFGDREFRVQRS